MGRVYDTLRVFGTKTCMANQHAYAVERLLRTEEAV